MFIIKHVFKKTVRVVCRLDVVWLVGLCLIFPNSKVIKVEILGIELLYICSV